MATEKFANNAQTTLNGSIDNSQTTLVVISASQFPSSGNFRIIIDSEIFIVTGVSGTTFTVATRPSESTSAASHSNGATVTCILTAGSINAILSALSPQGRLTLTTGVPYLVSSVTAATTVYYTPAVGDFVKLYDGSSWGIQSFSELSQATTDATKSPAACTTNSNYDVFVWSDSGTIRATRGPLWSSDTSRGTGAGTTELTFLNGTLVNANAITNGPGANKGTYVGTFRTNGSSQVDMIFGGTGANGGESTILGFWNFYNQTPVTLRNWDNTASYNYTALSWRIKNNNNANKISFVTGWAKNDIRVFNSQLVSNTNASILAQCGIQLDATTPTGSTFAMGSNSVAGTGLNYSVVSSYSGAASLGFHYFAPLEESVATGTTSWKGDGTNPLSIFFAETMF